MDTLIRKALIVDPTSPYNGQTKDLLLSGETIREIADDIPLEDRQWRIVDEKGLCVSPGWMDTACRFGEPLYEEAETLESGARAAARGGFTAVALASPKNCPTDSRQKVEFFVEKSASLPVNLYPVGTATQAAEGKAMAETYDMLCGGAVAFWDGRPIDNNLIEQLVLQYNGALGALTVTTPMDRSIMHVGVANEGPVATTLGLHGIPDIAEDIAVSRDIFLAQYTGAPLHIACVTTPGAVRMIREARKKGVDVSCSVTPHHLLLDDSCLQDFDTRYKVLPPLRTRTHIAALVRAVKDGTVCCIASDHTPVDIEDKKCEYQRAAYGTIGLQTAFGAAWKALHEHISLERMVELMSIGPRRRFGVEVPSIVPGGVAEMTLFDPSARWTFTKDMIESRAKNSAMIGCELLGEVFAVYVKGHLTV